MDTILNIKMSKSHLKAELKRCVWVFLEGVSWMNEVANFLVPHWEQEKVRWDKQLKGLNSIPGKLNFWMG